MQPEAFEAKFADAVERTFRDDAIRTAVLIDDQFPDYLGMRDATDEEFKEIDRAKNIYAFMHRKGLICDIQNWRRPGDADMDLLDKIRKSDLILLDYELGAGPKTALEMLRHLAVSPHFKLVVLYTAEAWVRVALAAAVAMRGLALAAPTLTPTPQLLEAAEDLLGQFREIDATGLSEYLTSGDIPWAADLREAMQKAQIEPKYLKPLADHIARRWTASLFDQFTPAGPELSLHCAVEDPARMWIQCGNCFVAIVAKIPAAVAENEGDYVWRQLGEALRAWRPNLYRLILSEIQNALELEAVVDHEAWLNDDLCLGLGLYLLESEAAAEGRVPPSDVEGSTQNLVDRFVDLIRRRIAFYPRITGTAAELLNAKLTTAVGPSNHEKNARHVRARELAHVSARRKTDWQGKVLPTVNAFMVSDEFRGAHITTGTVLRGSDGTHWLCASPACDLVPRASAPVMVQLIRLVIERAPREKFSPGEYVIIGSLDGPVIMRALEVKTRQPSLAVLILPHGTRVTRSESTTVPTIVGWIATDDSLRRSSAVLAPSSDTDGSRVSPAHGNTSIPADARPVEAPERAAEVATASPGETAVAAGEKVAQGQTLELVAPVVFTVASQLRSSFATRFLMAAGQHLSRIGVDFVDP